MYETFVMILDFKLANLIGLKWSTKSAFLELGIRIILLELNLGRINYHRLGTLSLFMLKSVLLISSELEIMVSMVLTYAFRDGITSSKIKLILFQVLSCCLKCLSFLDSRSMGQPTT